MSTLFSSIAPLSKGRTIRKVIEGIGNSPDARVFSIKLTTFNFFTVRSIDDENILSILRRKKTAQEPSGPSGRSLSRFP